MEIISPVLTSFLLLSGSLFCLVAAVGMLRLPDTLIRMHAATKAGTLGAGLILLAEAVHFGDTGITLRALAAVAFLLITAPVGAHLIGRASYFRGVRLYEKTHVDELQLAIDSRKEERSDGSAGDPTEKG
jgi:multicomponent Na+:H+ antiporter subunit G